MKTYYRTPEQQKSDFLETYDMGKPVHDLIMEKFPQDIEAQMLLDLTFTRLPRLVIYLAESVTAAETRMCAKWVEQFAPFGFNRFFRKDSGQFAFQGYTDEEKRIMVLLETKNSLNCDIKPVEVTVTQYKAFCGDKELAK